MNTYEELVKYAEDELQSGKTEKAESLLDEAIEIAPDQASAYYTKALLQADLGRLDEAIVCFQKTAKNSPRDATIFNNLGVLFYKKKNWKEAEAALEHAVTLDPDYIDAIYGLGKLYLTTDKKEQAILAFNRCLEIDVNCSKAKEALTSIVQESLKNISLTENGVDEYRQLGKGCVALGMFEEAALFYTHITHVDPNQWEPWLALGKVYQNSGKLDKAISAFEKCLEINSDCRAANDRLLQCKVNNAMRLEKDVAGAMQKSPSRDKPHVVYVGSKWCDGDPNHGITNSEHNFWESLKATGLVTQTLFHYDEYFHQNKKAGDDALVELCMREQPDVVVLEWLNPKPFNPAVNTLRLINHNMHIPIVTIWMDHVWDVHIQNAERIDPYVTLHVVTDTASCFARVKHPEKYLFLWGPQDPNLYFNSHNERDLPITFMGRLAKVGRKEAVMALKEAGIGFYHDGGQREHRVTPEEYADIYRRSRIVVNFSSSPSGFHQLIGRVFEVTLAGAMLLEEANSETAGVFIPMVDYVPYNGVKDLVEKAKYYVAHPDECAVIAKRGYEKALRYYDHNVFWQTIFAHVKLTTTGNNGNGKIKTHVETASSTDVISFDDKIKMYIYPHAKKVACDANPNFANTVPFSEKGIEEWVEMVPPDEAELFYMGQTTDSTIKDFDVNQFAYFWGNEDRHIVDIEGDWYNRAIAQVHPYFQKSIVIARPADESIKDWQVCVKPPFSYLFIDILKNRHDHFPAPENMSFGFKGCMDKGGVRAKVYNALKKTNLKHEYILNKNWYGRTGVEHQAIREYQEFMTKHLFALCPRGTGHDSIRFYEACYFERVPVVIADSMLLGEDYYDMSFLFKISAKSSEDQIADELRQIAEISRDEAVERGKRARRYFEEVVRQYYSDPTRFFIEFLNRHELRIAGKKREYQVQQGVAV